MIQGDATGEWQLFSLHRGFKMSNDSLELSHQPVATSELTQRHDGLLTGALAQVCLSTLRLHTIPSNRSKLVESCSLQSPIHPVCYPSPIAKADAVLGAGAPWSCAFHPPRICLCEAPCSVQHTHEAKH